MRGEGALLFRAEGPPLIDAISSWWVTLHGHAHPVVAAAIAEQAATLEQVIFAEFTHPQAERLAMRLAFKLQYWTRHTNLGMGYLAIVKRA